MNEILIAIASTSGAALLNFLAIKTYQLFTNQRKTFFWKDKNETIAEFTWKDITNGALDLKQQIHNSGYMPTMLVGIGRGGAIISSLLSGCLRNGSHVPFIALERKYDNIKGMKKASLFEDVDFSKDLDRVILVAGDLVTGETARVFYEFLQTKGAKEVKFLVFVMVTTSNMKPDYFYKKTNIGKFKFPWMLSGDYSHDSRVKL